MFRFFRKRIALKDSNKEEHKKTYDSKSVEQLGKEVELDEVSSLHGLRTEIVLNPVVASVSSEIMKPETTPEIKDMLSEIIVNQSAALEVKVVANYEPTLDLSNYKYPSIDLLEISNINKDIVGIRNLIASEKFQINNFSLPIILGKKINNENFIVDFASMPHLFIMGAIGQGKSVCIHSIIISLLYKKHPSQLKFILIDPKKVELGLYRTIEHHFLAKLPNAEPILSETKKVANTLNALCIEMDNRYDLLKEAGCRNIKEYNEKFVNRKLNLQKGHQYLPFIVLVIDEFSDLIASAGKEVEMPIARLSQLAHTVGIHMIISTSRFSFKVFTTNVRMNFLTKIAFHFSSVDDGKKFIGNGYKGQLHKGELLLSYDNETTKIYGSFIDTPEISNVCNFISEQQGYPEAFLLPELVNERDFLFDYDLTNRDPLFEDAARLIVQNQVGSISLIQRRMKLGYNRAGRLMDQLETAGVVGANQGSNARDVLIKTDAELKVLLDNLP